MKKDIEWLKEEVWKQDTAIAKDYIYIRDLIYLIDQLNEPEVLSQDWIGKHKVARVNNLRKMTMSDVVPVDKLQDLLVPKQELPAIPKYVADWIEEMKQDERPLYSVMSSLMNKTNHEWAVWKSANNNFSEIVAQAWLDGYEVEEEQKYFVDLDTAAYVAKWNGDGQVDIYTDDISGSDEFEFHLTEEEIKNYDERFWPFAEPVE